MWLFRSYFEPVVKWNCQLRIWVKKYQNQNWNTFAGLEGLAANIDGMMVMDCDIIILAAFPSFNFYIAI